MHYWGDDWFENNGKIYMQQLIENYLRKHLHWYMWKRKNTERIDEYLSFGTVVFMKLFGHSCFIGTYKHYKNEKLKNFIQ